MVTALGGMWQYQNELDGKLGARPQVAAIGLASAHGTAGGGTTAGSGSTSSPAQSKTGTGSGTARGIIRSGAAQSGGSGKAAPASAAPAASYDQPAAPQTVIAVSLSINGHAKGSVKLTSGSTQCDVLSQALAEGVISSLDMRYISQYGTEGVYVIDGMGDPGVVWWTYQVNGHAPPYGCGYTTAHDGDSVNWQYVKS